MTLLETLIAARRERGLSQQQIADRLKVTRPTVSLWETGRREAPMYRVEQYAEAVGLRIVAVPEHAA